MPVPINPPFWPIGKVSVVAAGTPVGLLDAFTPPGGSAGGLKAVNNGGLKLRVSSILFTVLGLITVNTGYVYIGFKGMNKATGAGVVFALPAAAAGVTNWFTLPSVGWGGANEVCPEDLFLDADTSGNSALVTLIQY
jgi:hypothetical protein